MVDNELITKVRIRNVKSILSNVFGSSFTLSNGNGTTANGSAVDLGGQFTSIELIHANGNRVSFDGDVLIFESVLTGYRGQTVYIGTDPNDNQRGFSIYEYITGSGPTVSDLKFRIDGNGIKYNLGSHADGDTYFGNSSGYLTKKGISTETSIATLNINSDNTYLSIVTEQEEAIIIANPTGTPFTGQELSISLKDNGVSRAISFGNQYVEFETFPTATTAGKRMYLGFVYNGTGWDYMGSRTQL